LKNGGLLLFLEDVAARRGVKTFDTPEEVFADLGI
jgi:hypothetical protein